jgi:hypothetical protein
VREFLRLIAKYSSYVRSIDMEPAQPKLECPARRSRSKPSELVTASMNRSCNASFPPITAESAPCTTRPRRGPADPPPRGSVFSTLDRAARHRPERYCESRPLSGRRVRSAGCMAVFSALHSWPSKAGRLRQGVQESCYGDGPSCRILSSEDGNGGAVRFPGPSHPPRWHFGESIRPPTGPAPRPVPGGCDD